MCSSRRVTPSYAWRSPSFDSSGPKAVAKGAGSAPSVPAASPPRSGRRCPSAAGATTAEGTARLPSARGGHPLLSGRWEPCRLRPRGSASARDRTVLGSSPRCPATARRHATSNGVVQKALADMGQRSRARATPVPTIRRGGNVRPGPRHAQPRQRGDSSSAAQIRQAARTLRRFARPGRVGTGRTHARSPQRDEYSSSRRSSHSQMRHATQPFGSSPRPATHGRGRPRDGDPPQLPPRSTESDDDVSALTHRVRQCPIVRGG
jgi:hypothetical protein